MNTATKILLPLAIAIPAGLLGLPSQANSLSKNIRYFCDSAVKFNQNIKGSIAPGSSGARRVSNKVNISSDRYELMWAVAKTNSYSSCQRMW